MQAENLSVAQQRTGAPDTTAALDRLGGAVERVTEVRSAEDLWRVAGEFREELIRFAFQALIALGVLAAISVVT